MLKRILFCVVVGFGGSVQAAEISYRPFEFYLNKINTLKAKFVQIDGQGRETRGDLYMAKPGLLRLNYTDQPMELVADGTWLIHNDKELNEISRVLLSTTPAAVLLKTPINIKKDVVLKDIYTENSHTVLELAKPDDPDSGFLSLYFSTNPVHLVGWKSHDSQNQEISVRLEKVEENIPLESKLFKVYDPNFDKAKRTR